MSNEGERSVEKRETAGSTASLVAQVLMQELSPARPNSATPQKKLKSAQELLAELKANPTMTLEPDDVRHFVRTEFPEVESWPTAQDMDDSVLTTGDNSPYRIGQWIERLGNDMIWHLEPIRRISRSVKIDENGQEVETIWYKTNCGISYALEDIRAPREG